MKLVVVTACPTGIAHCWMAAERIERAAAHRGHDVTVEVRAAGGVEDELPPVTIEAADAAIVAADAAADVERFAHLPTVETSAHEAVTSAPAVVDAAEKAVAGVEDSPDGGPEESERTRVASRTEAEDDEGLLGRAFGLFGERHR